MLARTCPWLPALRRAQRGSASRGLTLIEVLISMFVLAIGLFGVAAMLPLGQKKMLEGVIDQRKSHAAEVAFENLRSQGGLNPSRWVFWDGSNWDGASKITGARILCKATAIAATQVTTNQSRLIPTSNFYNTIPYTPTPSPSIVEFRTGTWAGTRRQVLNYGYVNASTQTFTFPISLTTTPPALGPNDCFVVTRVSPFAIDPLSVAFDPATVNQLFAVGMPRLSLWSSVTNSPLGTVAAQNLCRLDDDLSFDVANSNADATQLYYSEPYIDANKNNTYDAGDTFTPAVHDSNGNGTWDGNLRRKSAGSYSWAATFVPMGVPNNNTLCVYPGQTEFYRATMVVFYNRVLARFGTVGGPVQLNAQFVGSGYGGGTILLFSPNGSAAQAYTDLEPLRAGHWLLVSRGTPDFSDHRWYRVETVGDRFQDSGNANRWTRNVTLAGADWNTSIGLNAEVVYYPGVVGAFERTVKLDTIPDSSN